MMRLVSDLRSSIPNLRKELTTDCQLATGSSSGVGGSSRFMCNCLCNSREIAAAETRDSWPLDLCVGEKEMASSKEKEKKNSF